MKDEAHEHLVKMLTQFEGLVDALFAEFQVGMIAAIALKMILHDPGDVHAQDTAVEREIPGHQAGIASGPASHIEDVILVADVHSIDGPFNEGLVKTQSAHIQQCVIVF